MVSRGISKRRPWPSSLASTPFAIAAGLCWSCAASAACEPTETDAREPPDYPPQALIAPAGPEELGERLLVSGQVVGTPDCGPVRGAIVEVWQPSTVGRDYVQQTQPADERYLLRGRLRTDQNGRYRFETIIPASYPVGGGLQSRPKILFRVSHPDYQVLTTRLYVGGADQGDDPFGRRGRVVQAEQYEAGQNGVAYRRVEFDMVIKLRPE